MILRPTILVTLLLLTISASAQEDIDMFETGEKARRSHELASSDMMYQQEETKALYYQNQQIIHLLKEISATLNAIKAKNGIKTEEA